MKYLCPICKQTLTLQENTWYCPSNHRFDCAKEGYVNLLPVQNKGSKDPGDNKEMMFARREFLNKGHYQGLSDRINELACSHGKDARIGLDIGCGEGYYSHRLQEALSELGEFKLLGLDISKSALKYASKRYKAIDFCVASAFEMPFADESFDLMLRIYAPSLDEELRRVINKGGILITASAGKHHHFALKQLIYADPKPHMSESSHIQGFELLHRENLESIMILENEIDISHFLNMTPYSWKLTDEQKSKLVTEGLKCELDFKIEVFRAV
ncbi:23S rRNA (guanine(745)-N(1))-methyltransferase [Shewanella sp. D64]|uniref:23S rRNA (guanine(745)-N(1))-methyltransferase n=1 Tax=unclassified Shewanella TaxID=196818 RepID=UPI0022BA660A|nr:MULTISPECIES: 23S rRNA (guanine(745)-N(1))-methyltransferase [unclassified Shewanella]MEC4724885.1 23S rRNA (guanine(745)-N(1))-methyltransferase [Shewanella sp. D64]MEC4736322.1 23S rRNA (guanine(745)-N(1))-methyltransferase [Shewanella sp. E94]WBJ97617.1 23S rRNA (guanine(745)-N(1))-methyltransferase [Shewanella sp. MTB7]